MNGAFELRGWPRVVVALGLSALAASTVWYVITASFVLTDGQRYFALADDAMISMRYAWNLAHGQGLVWNPGEHVEGYTNPLLTLIMAVVCRIVDEKRLAVLVMQILGALEVAVLAQLVAMLAAELGVGRNSKAQRWIVALAFVWTCLHYPLVGWSLSGGEVTLEAIFLTWLAYVTERSRRRPGIATAAYGGVLGAAGYLVRPDATIGVAVLLLAWMPRLRSRAERLAAWLPLLATVAVHLVSRRAYYGAWLPNTYFLKVVGIPLGVRLENGWIYTGPYLLKSVFVAIPAVVGVWRQPRPRPYGLLIVLPALALYEIWVGGDAFPGWRLLIPGLLLLAPPALHGVCDMAEALVSRHPDRQIAAFAATLTLSTLGWLALPDLGERHRTTLFTVGYHGSAPPPSLYDLYPDDDITFAAHNRTNAETALVLNELLKPGDRIAVFWAGVIPYYSNFRAIDLLGKSDAYVARLAPDLTGGPVWFGMTTIPGHNKYDLRHSLAVDGIAYIQHDRYGHDDLRSELSSDYQWVQYDGVWLLLRRALAGIALERSKVEKVGSR